MERDQQVEGAKLEFEGFLQLLLRQQFKPFDGIHAKAPTKTRGRNFRPSGSPAGGIPQQPRNAGAPSW